MVINEKFNLGLNTDHPHENCISCIEGKSRRKGISNKIDEIHEPIDVAIMAYVDILGPISGFTSENEKERIPSLGGGVYALVFVEAYSRFVFISILQKKSQATREICKIVNQIP